MVWRPLEGFVSRSRRSALPLSANLPQRSSHHGNTVVWKPSKTAVYSAWLIMKVLKEAGLPDGVINLVYADGRSTAEVIFAHRSSPVAFHWLHRVFNSMWKTIATNMEKYKSYPRIVGKRAARTTCWQTRPLVPGGGYRPHARGAFEYQGQKCSAASRVSHPSTLWDKVKQYLGRRPRGHQNGNSRRLQ